MNPRQELPAIGEPQALRLPAVQQVRFANGLDVRIVERRDLPVVDVQLVTRAGAAHDTARYAGRAHLTADLLDEGTVNRSAPQIAEEAETLGASIRTRASWDYAAASLHVLSNRLEPAIDLLADIALRPAFSEREFARKQQERLHAIAQERDDPRNLASQAFARLIFGAHHPYGSPIGGVHTTVSTLDTHRLQELYAARYVPASSFLVVCGDVDTDACIALLERHFGAWRGGAAEVPLLPPPPPARPTAVYIVDRPGAPQSEIRVGHWGPPRRTEDYVALHVANTILGGAFTSRLNILLREEKGYTYGAGSSFAFRQGGGPFLASTAVATSATADAVNDMVREVGRLVAEPVSAEELARAQSYLVLGLPRTVETTGDVAEHVSELAVYDLPPDYYEQYTDAVQRVTAADVLSAADRWLHPQNLVVVIAGDAASIRAELVDLEFGAVHEYDDG